MTVPTAAVHLRILETDLDDLVSRRTILPTFRTSWSCAEEVASDAIQLHGCNDHTREYPLERHHHHINAYQVGDGTSEIQRIIIAKGVLSL